MRTAARRAGGPAGQQVRAKQTLATSCFKISQLFLRPHPTSLTSRLAPTRFSPAPPAVVDSRNTCAQRPAPTQLCNHPSLAEGSVQPSHPARRRAVCACCRLARAPAAKPPGKFPLDQYCSNGPLKVQSKDYLADIVEVEAVHHVLALGDVGGAVDAHRAVALRAAVRR